MHINDRLINNYASALFSKTNKCSVVILEQLKSIEKHVDILIDFMSSPLILLRNKQEVIDMLCNSLSLDMVLKNFLLLLVRNNRFPIICDVIKEYAVLCDLAQEVVSVQIRSSKILSEEVISLISHKMQKDLKKSVRICTVLDRTLIGGIVIEYDDRVLDYSVSGFFKHVARVRL